MARNLAFVLVLLVSAIVTIVAFPPRPRRTGHVSHYTVTRLTAGYLSDLQRVDAYFDELGHHNIAREWRYCPCGAKSYATALQPESTGFRKPFGLAVVARDPYRLRYFRRLDRPTPRTRVREFIVWVYALEPGRCQTSLLVGADASGPLASALGPVVFTTFIVAGDPMHVNPACPAPVI